MDPDESEAGASSLGDGGSSLADGGEDVAGGGKSVTPPQGGRAGSSSAGAGGTSTNAGTTSMAGSSANGGSPDEMECGNVIAPELPHDCQKLVCSMGMLKSEEDPDDTPEPRGPCDVPLCIDGKPTFESDSAQCQINESCGEGRCSCVGCPNGKVPVLSSDLCRLPAGVGVSANKTLTGSAAAQVADGNAQTTWNSGAPDGVLTISPASPQPMTAVAMWLTGAAENNTTPDKRYISVHLSVETKEGTVLNKSGNFSFVDAPTGPLRLDFGLANVKKLTLTFESPSTWIAVNEVIFEICPVAG